MPEQMTNEKRSEKRAKDPMWRFAFGVPLAFLGIKSLFLPNPNIPVELQYSNQTQKVSGEFVQAVLTLIGIWLIYRGITLIRQNRTKS
jgi:hypothetical protein